MPWLDAIYIILELITSSILIYSNLLLYHRHKRTGKKIDRNVLIASLLAFTVYISLTIPLFLELELTGIYEGLYNVGIYAFLIPECCILIYAFRMVEGNEVNLEESVRAKSEELVAKTIQEREAMDTLRRQHAQELIVGARRITSQIKSNLLGSMKRINTLFFLVRDNPDFSTIYIDELEDEFNNSSRAMLELTKKTLLGELRITLNDLDDVIQRAIRLTQPPENVTVTYDPQFNVIEVDTNKMTLVFENLIQNSIEAMPDGGEVDIGVRFNNGEVLITVTDSGSGINNEDRDKIFTPFFSTKQESVGLGLAYCRDVVMAHGGSISFMSDDDSTSFVVVLPKMVDVKR